MTPVTLLDCPLHEPAPADTAVPVNGFGPAPLPVGHVAEEAVPPASGCGGRTIRGDAVVEQGLAKVPGAA